MATYSYSGRPQFVTVAADGLYQIDAYGGQGGAYNGGGRGNVASPGTGGLGAESSGVVSLTAGEKLEIVVGGAGTEGSGPGGGGGGGSFVLANVAGKYVPLIVAGGGGGALYANGHGGLNTAGSGNGGAGYYAAGAGGAGVKSNGGSVSSGSGGFGTASGGSNGSGNYAGGGYTPPNTSSGQFRTGGTGGFGGGGAGGTFGGGGGGGYTGGHGGYGGEAIGEYSGYAAGGGSFAAAAAITPLFQAGINNGNGRIVIAPVCFANGTRIRVVRDEGQVDDISVERLAIGDLVVTSSGERRAIRWIGHRSLVFRDDARRSEAMPVRIVAHAFGENRPVRDLLVSPGHSLCVDICGEILIPAMALVDGATIVQEVVDRITYWHVELDSHEILLAENLPCESYLEMGNRGFFTESRVARLHAVPDAPVAIHADFCRPFHAQGPLVAFVRERLRARQIALGWRREPVSLEGNLHLLVDGARLEPDVRGLSVRFLVPASARDVWLVSNTAVPAYSGEGPDTRTLGVRIGAIRIDDGFGDPRVIAADDPRLCVGFHAVEEGPHRWTAGRSQLPADLWDGCHGDFFLGLELTRPALPRWVAPREARATQRVAAAG